MLNECLILRLSCQNICRYFFYICRCRYTTILDKIGRNTLIFEFIKSLKKRIWGCSKEMLYFNNTWNVSASVFYTFKQYFKQLLFHFVFNVLLNHWLAPMTKWSVKALSSLANPQKIITQLQYLSNLWSFLSLLAHSFGFYVYISVDCLFFKIS